MGAEDLRKTGKAWEHSPHEWMQGGRGGEGPIFKYLHTKLENEFVGHTKVWSPKLGRVLKQMIQCIALGSWAPPPTSTLHLPDVIHVMNPPQPSPFFAGLPVRYCEQKWKGKAGEAWEPQCPYR